MFIDIILMISCPSCVNDHLMVVLTVSDSFSVYCQHVVVTDERMSPYLSSPDVCKCVCVCVCVTHLSHCLVLFFDYSLS